MAPSRSPTEWRPAKRRAHFSAAGSPDDSAHPERSGHAIADHPATVLPNHCVEIAHTHREIALARGRVTELVDDAICVELRGVSALDQIDERVAERVHARGEGARRPHGGEPVR